jgi:hypothetical protein
MVDSLGRVDHAFADDPVSGLQTLHILADFNNLADPFVAGYHGI